MTIEISSCKYRAAMKLLTNIIGFTKIISIEKKLKPERWILDKETKYP